METNIKISNRHLYYASIVTRMVTFMALGVYFIEINLLFNSIANENNFNWNVQERKKYLSILGSIPMVGGIVGALTAGFFVNFNTRITYNVFRILAASFCFLFLIPNIPLMIVSRFLFGYTLLISKILTFWSIYQIALPEHKSRMVALLYLFAGLSGAIFARISSFDTGSFYYWRVLYGFKGVLLLFAALYDIFFIPHVNSISFLLSNYGEEKTQKIIKNYYSDEVARKTIDEYKKNLLLQQNLHLFIGKNSPDLDTLELKIENVHPFEQIKRDFNVFGKEIMNVFIFGMLLKSVFNHMILYLSVIICSKTFEDKERVREVKEFISYGIIIETSGYLASSVFNWIRLRRKALFIGHTLLNTCVFGVAYGYICQDLQICKYSLLLYYFAVGIFLPAFHQYNVDLCPPSFSNLSVLVDNIFGGMIAFFVPMVFSFETSSYTEIGLKFFGVYLIGFVTGRINMNYVVVDVREGMSKNDIYFKVREKDNPFFSRNKGDDDGWGFLEQSYASTSEEKKGKIR